ncbi:MAG TPA: hypothetical protein VF736_20780 [Pyrinomonadaceae bacterium]|jgi:hypothetical protein
MNPPNKKRPEAKDTRQQPAPRTGPAPPLRPSAAQAKRLVPAQTKTNAVAPAAYRPQPAHEVLQRKTAHPQQGSGKNPEGAKRPAAPPAYRPQPTPKVLQLKTAHGQAPPVNNVERKPVAPPAYRPQPAPLVLQRKAVAGRPAPSAARARPSPAAPPAYRPQPEPRVLQRKASGVHKAPAGAANIPPSAPPAVRPRQESNASQRGGRVAVIQAKRLNVIQRMEHAHFSDNNNNNNNSSSSGGGGNTGGLGYNQQEVAPFLVDRSSNLKSEPISRKDPTKEKIMMYHTTSWKNLVTIKAVGLNPALGGKSGGSCTIGGGEELQKSSIKNTTGKTAAGSSNQVVAPYIHQRGAWADLVLDTPAANFEVLLRFPCTVAKDWVIDPDHPNGAWHTKTKIAPGDIECLLLDGWVPIQNVPVEQLFEQSGGSNSNSNSSSSSSSSGINIFPTSGPNQGILSLAFTLAEFQNTFPSTRSLNTDDSGKLLEQLKEMYKELWADGISFVFKGATAHPISTPSDWLFVVQTENSGNLAQKFATQLQRYIEKIHNPGWGVGQQTSSSSGSGKKGNK